MEARTHRRSPTVTEPPANGKKPEQPPAPTGMPAPPDGIYLTLFWGGATQENIGFQFAPDSTYDEMALGISSAVERMMRKAAELEKGRAIGSLMEQIADLKKQLEAKNGEPDRQHSNGS